MLVVCASHCERVHVYAVTRETTTEVSAERSDDEAAPSSSSGASSANSGVSSEASRELSGASNEATSEPRSSTGSAASATTAEGSSSNDACDGVEVTPGDTSLTVAVGSLERRYVLHVPATVQVGRPAPLIIDFHGAGGSGDDQLQDSPYPPVTDREGVIMAFPDGVNGPIGRAWNVGPCCVPGVDDLAFVDALLTDVVTRACIDVERVYAVGVLTGGGMAHYLACERADAFAAVAPAAFDLAEETVEDCKPTRPVGVVAFRGTADERVPYEGGSSMLVPNMSMTFLGAEASFERWASINGCDGAASVVDDRGCKTHSNCMDGIEVVLCTKTNGPAEPGDATIAWPILSRHRR